MAERPIILVIGNCQSGRIASFLRSLPYVHANYEVKFFRNFTTEDKGSWQNLTQYQKEIADYLKAHGLRVVTLIRQQTHSWFNDGITQDDLAPGTRIIQFPVAMLNYIWPFRMPDPKHRDFDPGSAEKNLFPEMILDDNLFKLAEQGVPPEDVVDAYLSIDITKTYRLDRLKSINAAKARQVDEMSDFGVWDYIEGHIGDKKVLRHMSHPNGPLLALIFKNIVERMDLPEDRAIIDGHLRDVELGHGIQGIDAPVHPVIAAHFGLKWAIDGKFRFWDEGKFSFDEYLVKLYTRGFNRQAIEARQLISDGELEKAVPLLREAIRQTPRSPDFHAMLGQTLSRLKRNDEAAVHMQAALDLEPSPRNTQSLFNALRGDGKHDEAQEFLDGLAPETQESLQVAVCRINSLLRERRLEDALRMTDDAISRYPHAHHLMKVKGDILARLKDFEGARAAYKRVVYLSCDRVDFAKMAKTLPDSVR